MPPALPCAVAHRCTASPSPTRRPGDVVQWDAASPRNESGSERPPSPGTWPFAPQPALSRTSPCPWARLKATAWPLPERRASSRSPRRTRRAAPRDRSRPRRNPGFHPALMGVAPHDPPSFEPDDSWADHGVARERNRDIRLRDAFGLPRSPPMNVPMRSATSTSFASQPRSRSATRRRSSLCPTPQRPSESPPRGCSSWIPSARRRMGNRGPPRAAEPARSTNAPPCSATSTFGPNLRRHPPASARRFAPRPTPPPTSARRSRANWSPTGGAPSRRGTHAPADRRATSPERTTRDRGLVSIATTLSRGTPPERRQAAPTRSAWGAIAGQGWETVRPARYCDCDRVRASAISERTTPGGDGREEPWCARAGGEPRAHFSARSFRYCFRTGASAPTTRRRISSSVSPLFTTTTATWARRRRSANAAFPVRELFT